MQRELMQQYDRVKIFNALTEYDRKQSTKRGYNPYALGHYAKALKSVATDMEHGAPSLRVAVLVNFSDRLLDCVLRSVGEAKFTREEMQTARTWPIPEDDDE